MYSFQPLVDYSQSHGLFYAAVVFLGVLAFGLIGLFWDCAVGRERLKFIIPVLILYAFLVGVTGISSYSSVAPKNERVVGEFVSYMAEGFREQSGKTKVDRHRLYVIYKVPAGNVVMAAGEGMIYPKRAVLYKN